MIIETFITTAFQQNARVISCEETQQAIVIDPGDSADGAIAEYINKNELKLQAVALTHAHLDHIGGVSAVRKSFPHVEIILHKDDEEMYYALPQQPILMGVQPHQLKALGMDYEDPPQLTGYWHDGQLYQVGNLNFKVLHCPGHTRGHVVFVEEHEKKVIVGDCLFQGSIGRTDLPGGNYDQLIDSINSKILPLGDDFIVYTGHGTHTTIERERRTNPFLTGAYEILRGRFV